MFSSKKSFKYVSIVISKKKNGAQAQKTNTTRSLKISQETAGKWMLQ